MAPKRDIVIVPEEQIVRKRSKRAFDTVCVKKDSLIITTCKLSGVVELVDALNDRQRADVESIGFGGLLRMRLSRLNLMMVTWLVSRFNGGSRMLNLDRNRSFAVNGDDVFDMFMIPRGENSVVKFGKGDVDEILTRFKDTYDIEARSPRRVLYDVLTTDLVDGGDDFKRLFVLYVMSVFFDPCSNRLVPLGILKSLVDVQNICKFDWCGYVMDRICEVVTNYHMGKTKVLNCCVLVLQLAYLHRMKWQGIDEPRSLPLIQHWTNEKIDKRCDEEAIAGPYGDGELLLNVYPLSKNGRIKGDDKGKTSVDDDFEAAAAAADGAGAGAGAGDGDVKGKESGRFIKFVLPDGELDDDDIEKMAKDATHKSFLLFRRDISVVTNYHMERLLGVKKNIEEKISNTPPEVSDSQAFFSDAALHSYIDSVVANFLAMKKLASEMPSFELFSAEDLAGPSNLAEEEVLEEVFGDEKDVEPFWTISQDVGYVSDFMINSNKYLDNLNQMQKEVVDYCLFKGDGEASDQEELFRKGYFNYVNREDMMSLCPKVEIFQSVLTCWSLIVNHESCNGRRSRFVFGLEHSRNLANITVGLNVKENEKEMKGCWDSWMASNSTSTLMNAEMVFVPFCLEGHYAVMALNFIEKKVQYLDNRKYEDSENVFFRSAIILKDHLIKYLSMKKHAKAKEISKYEFEVVMFKWTSTNKDLDCGVYVMHHVKNFDGVPYSSPDLTKASIRRGLRAAVCANLVLSDINELRKVMTEKVYAFYEGKPELKENLKEKRVQGVGKKKHKTILQDVTTYSRKTRHGGKE